MSTTSWRALVCGLIAVAVCGSPTASRGQPSGGPVTDRHACDPISSQRPVPSPRSKARCGNGVIEDIIGTCEEVCVGGCGAPITCRTECQREPEHCDGRQHSDTCATLGYAGGSVGCTAECNFDLSPCVACVAGPGVECGAVRLPGEVAFVIGTGNAAAVVTRAAEGGGLRGATITAKLKTRPLVGLPAKTLAAGAVEGGLGFVDDAGRFGVISPDGKAQTLGAIGAARQRVLILRETNGGGAAVLAGEAQRQTLAIFDGPTAPAAGAVRHFYFGNLRIVVAPAGHELARGVTPAGAALVVIDGGTPAAFAWVGLELRPLATVPAGISLRFTYPEYTDEIRWSGGQLVTTRRTDPDTNHPPPGLSRAALSGVTMTAAFGGTLIARSRWGERAAGVELYWMAGPDPLAPR
jgi:hypothetical protein